MESDAHWVRERPLLGDPSTLPIRSLREALCAAYRVLGFESATQGDNVFRDLALARIVEPSNKIDAERVLAEVSGPGVVRSAKARAAQLMPNRAGGRHWRQRARPMPVWGHRRWCCSTSRRCASKPTPVTACVNRHF